MRRFPRLPDAAVTLVLLVLVYAAGVAAVAFKPEHSTVATWWPAAGLSAILLVRSDRRAWPPYAVGIVLFSGLANVTAGRDLLPSTLLGVANASEAVVIAALLWTPEHRRPPLSSPEDFFRLARACLLGAATMGVGGGLAIGLTGGDGLVAARTVAPAHLAATLVILPLLLVRPDLRMLRMRGWEFGVQSVLMVASVLFVFAPRQSLGLAFLTLPLLIWGALRLSPFVAAWQLVATAVMSTWLTAHGDGPFAVARSARIDGAVAGALVAVFVVAAALMTVTSALAADQRRTLLRSLTAERDLTSSMLGATAALIVVTDRDGTVLMANPGSERITGLTAEHMVGRRIWDSGFIPPERTDIVRQMFESADGSGVPRTREADVVDVAGKRHRVVWNNEVRHDEDGRVRHVIFTGTDVTQERTTAGLLVHLLEAPVATALVGLDPDGRISVFNRGAEELLGYVYTEMLGRPVEDIVVSGQPADYLARESERIRWAEDRDSVDEILDLAETSDWIWRQATGSRRTVSTTISQVMDPTGEMVGYLCVGRDVTEQRRTQELLATALEKEQDAVERLRRLDMAKNDFVSTVSHELRTPTTSIVGYTEMLLEGAGGELSKAQEAMLEAIDRNGRRLIAVAGDLLTLAGLEAEETGWERESVDLGSIVSQAEEAIRPLLTRRRLTASFEARAEVTVIGDAAHLDRVLMNLLSNAVKFTPDGGAVSCRLEAIGDWATLVVSDTGIGIPESEQGDLFTKFFRSSTAQERAIQGTGLGLSIVASIVSAHGGEIEVESAPNRGTTFTVRLPLARQAMTRSA